MAYPAPPAGTWCFDFIPEEDVLLSAICAYGDVVTRHTRNGFLVAVYRGLFDGIQIAKWTGRGGTYIEALRDLYEKMNEGDK